MKIDLPYLEKFFDRHGKQRVYYRRAGRHVPMQHEEGSPGFLIEYETIHASFQAPKSAKGAPGTFDALVEAFYAHHKFTKLKPTTRQQYRWQIEPARKQLGDIKLSNIDHLAIDRYIAKLLRGVPKKGEEPEKKPISAASANNALRTLGTLFDFAVKQKLIKANPAREVDKVKNDSDGWQPWPIAALERFEAGAEGSPWLAFMLAFYTGQRISDVLAMTWAQIDGGVIEVKQEKTGATVWVPLHPSLAAALERVKAEQRANVEDRAKRKLKAVTGLTIVQREDGQRYTKSGFGSVWQREQVRVKCKLPFHGLRKSAVIALLEAGCTPDEVKSVTGHTTDEMVAHYGKQVNARKLAKAAISKLIAAAAGNAN